MDQACFTFGELVKDNTKTDDAVWLEVAMVLSPTNMTQERAVQGVEAMEYIRETQGPWSENLMVTGLPPRVLLFHTVELPRLYLSRRKSASIFARRWHRVRTGAAVAGSRICGALQGSVGPLRNPEQPLQRPLNFHRSRRAVSTLSIRQFTHPLTTHLLTTSPLPRPHPHHGSHMSNPGHG